MSTHQINARAWARAVAAELGNGWITTPARDTTADTTGGDTGGVCLQPPDDGHALRVLPHHTPRRFIVSWTACAELTTHLRGTGHRSLEIWFSPTTPPAHAAAQITRQLLPGIDRLLQPDNNPTGTPTQARSTGPSGSAVPAGRHHHPARHGLPRPAYLAQLAAALGEHRAPRASPSGRGEIGFGRHDDLPAGRFQLAGGGLVVLHRPTPHRSGPAPRRIPRHPAVPPHQH